MGGFLTTRLTLFVLMFSLAGAVACGPPPSSGGSSTCQSDDDCRADFACAGAAGVQGPALWTRAACAQTAA